MNSELQPNLMGNDFEEQIRKLVREKNLTYMDAVIHWCTLQNIELEVGGELVDKSELIKAKIEEEAEDLNFLKKTNRLRL